MPSAASDAVARSVRDVGARRAAWTAIWTCVLAPAVWASEPQLAAPADAEISAEQRQFFENKIRPVLVKHCYECHSADATEIGGRLMLDSREAMRLGGESGPALVLEDHERSLLLHALRYEGIEMPPEAPLPESVVQDFSEWVRMGAPDPRVAAADVIAALQDQSNSPLTSHWSFQSVQSPAIPSVQMVGWVREPIDHFILAKIEAAGLAPTHDAPPEVLLRRLSYDLTGMPPTAAQSEAFVADYHDRGQAAVRQVVDTMLASPQYGERWGRHWLDVARYGESNGNDGLSRNPTFPHAWRYRDYVIAAFNEDVSYDHFVSEQIAGDLLPAETPEQRDRQLIASGFLALGSKPAKAMNVEFEMDIVADQIDVVSTTIMGLSVACARCHDHKHDPIPTSDYYALAGIFRSTETMWGLAANEKLTAPATPLHQLAGGFGATDSRAENKGDKDVDTAAQAMGVRDLPKPQNCKINIKGESKTLGPEVPRGFLSACQTEQPPPSIQPKQSGRLELARWLTRGDHPQTARVMVNRVWLQLFGQAIVATPDDFGVYGEAPSHPELLDHLASRFQAEGWSIKRLIRAIVLSRTYQLDSRYDGVTLDADPDNRLHTRHLRRRLDAESLRDSILLVSGELDRRPGQGSAVAKLDVLVNKHDSLHQISNHRSVYLCMLRNSPPPELAAFDLPDAIRPQGRRSETTLPTQSLFLLNSPLVVQQSRKFAQRLLEESGQSASARVRWAFHRALNRSPSEQELAQTVQMVEANESSTQQPEVLVWAAVCQALLASNEFRYVD